MRWTARVGDVAIVVSLNIVKFSSRIIKEHDGNFTVVSLIYVSSSHDLISVWETRHQKYANSLNHTGVLGYEGNRRL